MGTGPAEGNEPGNGWPLKERYVAIKRQKVRIAQEWFARSCPHGTIFSMDHMGSLNPTGPMGSYGPHRSQEMAPKFMIAACPGARKKKLIENHRNSDVDLFPQSRFLMN